MINETTFNFVTGAQSVQLLTGAMKTMMMIMVMMMIMMMILRWPDC